MTTAIQFTLITLSCIVSNQVTDIDYISEPEPVGNFR
jgi:hypothetical protein